jgi:metacaspase-1
MAKVALCVGIDYSGTDSELPDCVKDANDLSNVLLARGFKIETLLDKAATADAILDKLGEMIAALNYGDLFLFTYSGHGSWVPDQSGDEPDGRDEIICPTDIFQGNWISDDQLAEIFADRARGARVVFLSDSCHSGTVHKFATFPQAKAKEARSVRFLPPANFMKALAARTAPDAPPQRPTRSSKAASAALLLAGCQDWEFSYSTGTNGAFTRAALDALADEEILSYQDWYRAIRTKLPTSQYPQTPAIQGAVYQRRWGILEEGR